MANSIGDVNLRILLEIVSAEKNAKKFSASLKDVEVASKKASVASVNLADKIQQAGLRMDGFRAIVDVLRSTFGNLIQEYQKGEIALSKLSNGLKNVGESSSALDKLTAQASQLQTITPFADEEIINAQSMLTTFMKSSEEIEILTPRILDLAAAYMKSGDSGMDLQQVAVMLGKVNEETVGALRRVGVAFSDEQAEKLKSLRGTEQAIYLSQILDQNFKGMAETVGETAAGQLKIFDNKLSDVKESLGKILSDALVPLIKPLGDFLQTIANADQPTKLLTLSVLGLAAAFVVLNTSMGGIPYIIGAVLYTLAATYQKFKETGSIVRATEADFSSFGSAVLTIMQSLLFPIGLVKTAVWAVKRAIDDVIYRWNALRTFEFGKVIEPGFHELPEETTPEHLEAKKMKDAGKEYKPIDKPPGLDEKPPKTSGKGTTVQEAKTQLELLQEQYDKLKDSFEEPFKTKELQNQINLLQKYIDNYSTLLNITAAVSGEVRGRRPIEPIKDEMLEFELKRRSQAEAKAKSEARIEKINSGVDQSFSLANQLTNILNLGADSFIAKFIGGLQEGISLANSFANILSLILGGGGGGIFSLLGFAGGGQVPGAGSGDTVPAMLTPGEFVVKRSVVDRVGKGFFEWLNGGNLFSSLVGRFASGGLVTAAGAAGVQVVVLDTKIKGNDIVLSHARTTKQNNRRNF